MGSWIYILLYTLESTKRVDPLLIRAARNLGASDIAVMREVILPETITIQELAQRMSERAVDVVKFFMKQGQILKPGDVYKHTMIHKFTAE